MNKNYLALPATALCLIMGHAQAAPEFTVYGKANVTLNQVEDEASDSKEWQLNSNASRLGVKGSQEIDENLKAIFKMEFEVMVDDGKSSESKGGDTFEQRNVYAGFQGGFGTLIAGRHDTPLKLAQGKIDRFNDQVQGDIKNYMEGEDRVSNIVMYTTPAMSGVSLTAALIPGEDAPEGGESGISSGASYSVNYKNAWVKAALAHNNDVDSQDTTRLAADFSMGNTNIGLLAQNAEKSVDSSVDEDSILLSLQQKLAGGYALKAQYGQTDYSTDAKDTQIALGLDKKLSSKAKVFAYVASIEEDDGTDAVKEDARIAMGYAIKF